MDLIIRNIDPKVIYSIDKMIEQYNHQNKTKISRSKFLRDRIEKIPEEDLYKKLIVRQPCN